MWRSVLPSFIYLWLQKTLAFQRHQQNPLGMADDGHISTVPNTLFTNRASPTHTATRQTIKAMWPKQLAKRRPGQISSRWTGTRVLQVMQLSGIFSASISPSVIYDTSDLCFERADYDLIYTNPCKSYTSCQSTTQTLPVHLVKAPLALHQALCLFCPPPCPQQGGCHKAHIQPHRKVEFHLTVFPSSQQSFKTTFQTKEHVPRVQWQSFR